ncbi:MFS transporter [Sporomusa sp.]|uniref:MFS transporter n=1 Tax=Sporomusa sp. TaxID=2078658 RepID=UPI002CC3DA94|nr:MFS transporter [Sporomusa sp.]HWR44076.1 MFS transporter [Sporomusa sp.]
MSKRMNNSIFFNVSLLGAGHFFSDFYANFLPALLPIVMVKLGLSLTMSGMLVMAYSIISSVLQPISGYIIDKRGYAWLILVTIPVSAVFICLAGLADSKFTLFLLVGLAGLGASVFHPLAASLMGRVVTAETKGTAMSIFVFGGNVGYAVAPAVIMYLLNAAGTASLIWLIFPGLLVTGASYLAGLHKVDISPAAAREQEAVNEQAEPWYKSRGLILLNVANALRSWMQVALPTFLPVALAGAGQPPAVAASMLTVFLLSGACGALFGGWLGDKIGRKAGFIGSLILCIPVTYLFLSDLSPSLLSYSLLALSGALLQSTAPTSVVWAQELIPGNAAMASGMMLGLSFGLGGVGAAITGAMGDRIGIEGALMWSLFSLGLALILAFAIPQPEKKPVSNQILNI